MLKVKVPTFRKLMNNCIEVKMPGGHIQEILTVNIEIIVNYQSHHIFSSIKCYVLYNITFKFKYYDF